MLSTYLDFKQCSKNQEIPNVPVSVKNDMKVKYGMETDL